jgi:hypothetical protein
MIYQTALESLVAVALFAIITAKIIVITIAYYCDLLMRYLELKLFHWKGYNYFLSFYIKLGFQSKGR